MFVMFYICYKSKKEHTTWNDNSGMRVLHNFQCTCTFSAAIYCICDWCKFLYMDMTIALKSLNVMHQTASMRLTIIQHEITVKYVNYFQMYYYLMQ